MFSYRGGLLRGLTSLGILRNITVFEQQQTDQHGDDHIDQRMDADLKGVGIPGDVDDTAREGGFDLEDIQRRQDEPEEFSHEFDESDISCLILQYWHQITNEEDAQADKEIEHERQTSSEGNSDGSHDGHLTEMAEWASGE